MKHSAIVYAAMITHKHGVNLIMVGSAEERLKQVFEYVQQSASEYPDDDTGAFKTFMDKGQQGDTDSQKLAVESYFWKSDQTGEFLDYAEEEVTFE